MDILFEKILERLTLDDIQVLNILSTHESLSRYSAKSKQAIQKASNLSESHFRKCIDRLDASGLIEIIAGRNHFLYINEFGLKAIEIIYERSNA